MGDSPTTCQQASTCCLAGKHFPAALEGYTRAIELNPTSAVYHANRSAAHLRLEAYGSALSDATRAIELDPKYVKVSEVLAHAYCLIFCVSCTAFTQNLLAICEYTQSYKTRSLTGILPACGCQLCTGEAEECIEGLPARCESGSP